MGGVPRCEALLVANNVPALDPNFSMASRTPRVYPRSRVSSMQGPRTNKPRLVVRARRRRTSPAQRIQSDLERAGRFLMEHSVKARAAASVAAAVVATVLGLVAAAPHAANRDNPDLVLATIILSLVLPALAVGAVWWWNDGVLSTNRYVRHNTLACFARAAPCTPPNVWVVTVVMGPQSAISVRLYAGPGCSPSGGTAHS